MTRALKAALTAARLTGIGVLFKPNLERMTRKQLIEYTKFQDAAWVKSVEKHFDRKSYCPRCCRLLTDRQFYRSKCFDLTCSPRSTSR